MTPWFRLNIGDTVTQGQVIGAVDLSGITNDLTHVHVSRFPPGPGTVEDIVKRLKNGEQICNFDIPAQFK